MKTAALIGIAALIFAAVAGTIHGLILAFSASTLLGLIFLLLPALPLPVAIIAWCGHPEVCKAITTWLHLPL